MRLKSVTVENFRGYRDATLVPIDDFTSIVGLNEAGKSTLLEALDVFFDNRAPDSDDANIGRIGYPTKIRCTFDGLPERVVLDATVETSLSDEYLVGETGDLEILKVFDLTKSKIVPQVFANAHHPSADGANDLLQLTSAKLKDRAKRLEVEFDDIDARVNSEIRRAIWDQFDDLSLETIELPLNSDEGKKIWEMLQRHLPVFALFQADRTSHDDDTEVASPFDIAIKEAVRTLDEEINGIKKRVQDKVREVTARTIDKLREMDERLAEELVPIIRTEPKWVGFKLSLKDQDNIPINKRGSGVRRLILLNFFRAEAERRQRETGSPGVIFAVEEPESSQHPRNQKLLIDSLTELSTLDGAQVMITTHVPGIASMVSPESIRHVKKNNQRIPIVSFGEDVSLEIVANELGVLPDRRVGLLVYVEGVNDVMFFEHAARALDHIDVASDPRIAFVLAGGGSLKHWVNKNYLEALDIPQVHIYDRDDDAAYQVEVDQVNARGNNDWATLTNKRER